MAPNQQSLTHITESLSNLDLSSLVKPEFLPLAHHKEQQPVQDVTPSRTPAESDDYWSWTPSVEEEETQEIVSASHMEEQLLRDAQRRSQKVETVTSTQTSNVENYWDEGNDTSSSIDSPIVQAQHEESASYWTWNSDDKDVFSSESIVDNLIAQKEHLQTKSTDNKIVATSTTTPTNYWNERSETTIRATRTHANYWTWSSDAKAKMIAMIRKEAEARVCTSARHIEENLRREASDAYWNEAAKLSVSDQYWSWNSATPFAVLCAPNNYWDM